MKTRKLVHKQVIANTVEAKLKFLAGEISVERRDLHYKHAKYIEKIKNKLTLKSVDKSPKTC